MHELRQINARAAELPCGHGLHEAGFSPEADHIPPSDLAEESRLPHFLTGKRGASIGFENIIFRDLLHILSRNSRVPGELDS